MCIICEGGDITNLTSLNISGCERVTSLPGLPNDLKTLICNNCLSLSSLPYLPLGLQKLSCFNCPLLTSLPMWFPDSLKKFNCNNCPLLSRLPYLSDSLQELDCGHCVLLNSLPDLSSDLEKLACDGCLRLTSLPELPDNLKSLVCFNCPLLTSLPDLLHIGLIELNCNDCPLLASLPELPESLQMLDCAGCISLTSFDTIPTNLHILDIQFCTGITSLPPLHNGIEIRCQGSGIPAELCERYERGEFNVIEEKTPVYDSHFSPPPGDPLPFEIKERCMAETDLNTTENLQPIRDLVIFFFNEAKEKGECIEINDLVQTIASQRRLWVWRESIGNNEDIRIFTQPIFKLPWTNILIDYKTTQLVLTMGYNTILLDSFQMLRVGSSFGVSQLHGSEEKVWSGIPVHRKDFIERTNPQILIEDNARPEDLLTQDPLAGKDKIPNRNEDENHHEPRYLFSN